VDADGDCVGESLRGGDRLPVGCDSAFYRSRDPQRPGCLASREVHADVSAVALFFSAANNLLNPLLEVVLCEDRKPVAVRDHGRRGKLRIEVRLRPTTFDFGNDLNPVLAVFYGARIVVVAGAGV